MGELFLHSIRSMDTGNSERTSSEPVFSSGTEFCLQVLDSFLSRKPDIEHRTSNIEKLSILVKQGKSLRQAFQGLDPAEQESLRNKIGRKQLDHILAFSQETDPELFWEAALHFGESLMRDHQEERAHSVLAFLSQGGESIPSAVQAKAKLELEALVGKGDGARRLEYLGSRIVRDILAPRAIGPMVGASFIGNLVGSTVLGRLVTRFPMAWYGRGLASRFLAGTGGYLVEFPLFGVLNHAVAVNPQRTLFQEVGSAAFAVGFLKTFNYAGQKIFRKLHRLHEYTTWHELSAAAKFNQFLIPQTATFLGLGAAHKFEEHFELRDKVDNATFFVDTVESLFTMGIGGHLGHLALGRRIHGLQQELRYQAKTNAELAKQFLGVRNFSSAGGAEAPHSKLHPARNPIFTLMWASMGVGLGGMTGGRGKPPKPSIPERRKILDSFSREHGINPQTLLGRRYGKSYGKISEVEEGLEVIFGESTSPSRPFDEIHWIESHKIKGGYDRMIRSYFKHSERNVRIAALRALTSLKANIRIPELTDLLEPYLDPKRSLGPAEVAEAEAIMGALAFFKVPHEILHERTRYYLRILISHSNREVSAAAEAASIQLGVIPVTPNYAMMLRHQLPEVRIQTLSIVKAINARGYQDSVEALLRDSDPVVRGLAVETLGQWGGRKAKDLIAVMLTEDRHPMVREAAAQVLGDLCDRHSQHELIQALQDPDSRVLVAAAEALAKIGSLMAVPELLNHISSPNPAVRFAAAKAVAKTSYIAETLPIFQEWWEFNRKHRQVLKAILELKRRPMKDMVETLQVDSEVTLDILLADSDPDVSRLAALVKDRLQGRWDKEMKEKWENSGF